MKNKQVRGRVWDSVETKVSRQICERVESRAEGQVWNQIRMRVRGQVEPTLLAGIFSLAIRELVRD